jgi:signal transduction histidine kinase
MQKGKPDTKRSIPLRQELLRGDSLFALLIFVVVGVFLLTLIVSVWHNIVFQKDVRERASAQNAEAVGDMLAKSAEALIAAGELSTLRRIIAEAGLEHEWESCRVVLPDGGVLAAADPGEISVIELPASWGGQTATPDATFTGRTATFTFALTVPGRGQAALEIVAPTDGQLGAGLAPQTAQMAIACLALASMLLVHRHARFRLKAIGAIHEVLMAVREGNSDFSALELDPSLGREAQAWNKLLGEKQSEQVCTAIEQVTQAVREKSEAANELIAAFDAVPYGLVLTDDRMQVEHVNGAAAILLQTNRTDAGPRDVSEVIKHDEVLAHIRRAANDQAARRAVIEVEQAGSVTSGVLRFSVCPIRHEETHFALITIEDITQQRVAEAAMNSFLAKAAHELRTPLTNVRLYVEEALDQCERSATATSKCLNVINDEAQRLDRTVSEILSVSEIEVGSSALKRDDVRVGALLEQVKADHEAQARDRRIQLDFDLPPKLPVVQADRDKLALVLHNLLGNALKYTPDEGHVTVAATLEKGQFIVAVTDTGIGIDSEELERVFDKFYRSKDPRAAEIKGSGLGLAISREVARLHGGDITVESQLGQGSTFTLRLPIIEEVS